MRDTISVDKNVKWEPINKLHLTLKFIGNVSNEMMGKISDELIFFKEYEMIKCSCIKFGFFYRDRKPNILMAQLVVDDQLQLVIDKINETLNKFNIPTENRKFNPHITLLRIKMSWKLTLLTSSKNYF